MVGCQNTQLESKTNENGTRKILAKKTLNKVIMIENGQNLEPFIAPLLNLDQQFLRE